MVGIGWASVEEIDRLNIFQATMLAICRAVDSLPVRPARALIDGRHCPGELSCDGVPVVKGDSLSLSIAAASIIAKTERDALMATLHARHPHYGWDRNQGYGTAEHLRALADHGVTAHHRRTFSPVANRLRDGYSQPEGTHRDVDDLPETLR